MLNKDNKNSKEKSFIPQIGLKKDIQAKIKENPLLAGNMETSEVIQNIVDSPYIKAKLRVDLFENMQAQENVDGINANNETRTQKAKSHSSTKVSSNTSKENNKAGIRRPSNQASESINLFVKALSSTHVNNSELPYIQAINTIPFSKKNDNSKALQKKTKISASKEENTISQYGKSIKKIEQQANIGNTLNTQEESALRNPSMNDNSNSMKLSTFNELFDCSSFVDSIYSAVVQK